MGRPHSTFPPWRSSSFTNASVMACEPPLASGHAGGDEGEAGGVRQRTGERGVGVGGDARVHRARAGAEQTGGVAHRRQGADAEAQQADRVERAPDRRAHDRRRRRRPVLDEGAEQPLPARALAVGLDGLVDRLVQLHRAAVVERVGDRQVRVDPVDVELVEHGRRDADRVDRRAHVVLEARERQLLRAGPAAGRVPGLDDEDGASRLGDLEGGGQAVGAGTDDDGVVLVGGHGGGPTPPGR
jgi:hypothetical protein